MFGFDAFAAGCALEDDEKTAVGLIDGARYKRAYVFDFVGRVVFILGGKGIADVFCLALKKEYADKVLRVFRRAFDAHPVAT